MASPVVSVSLLRPWTSVKPISAPMQATDEPTYVKLVEALCAEHQINLIKVDNENLGELVGLCKIDREGKPSTVWVAAVSLSSYYGKESLAKDVIKDWIAIKAIQ
ncbi:40S ribosomal protein S12-like [Perca flavescens]|uniref:40S ribosomal protein S12-like n=1 Tax=Perca flavescens TaxID=8167 RepID=UPI00106E1712|nr:40S ribosomal protein S12-like [Perca flavescens]